MVTTHRAHKLQIDYPCRPELTFRVLRRKSGSSAPQSSTVTTGDCRFDDLTCIEEAGDQLEGLLRSSFIREAFFELLSLGFDEVVAGKNRISAIWSCYPKELPPHPNLVELTHKRLRISSPLTKPSRKAPAVQTRPAPVAPRKRLWMPIVVGSLIGLGIWWTSASMIRNRAVPVAQVPLSPSVSAPVKAPTTPTVRRPVSSKAKAQATSPRQPSVRKVRRTSKPRSRR